MITSTSFSFDKPSMELHPATTVSIVCAKCKCALIRTSRTVARRHRSGNNFTRFSLFEYLQTSCAHPRAGLMEYVSTSDGRHSLTDGTKGQRDRGTERQRDKETKRQRDKEVMDDSLKLFDLGRRKQSKNSVARCYTHAEERTTQIWNTVRNQGDSRVVPVPVSI